MITTTTTTTTTTTAPAARSPRGELRRLLGIFAAAAALTAGACADLDDTAWEETRGETANDSFDDEDYPIGRSHERDDVDVDAWGEAAYDLSEGHDRASEADDESRPGDEASDLEEEEEEEEAS